jgi:HK97 family phage prohead protease
MKLTRKPIRIELKSDGDGDDAQSNGTFVATFATFGVVDHHGDITEPTAFDVGSEVLIGAYQHDLMSLPVGKGVIGADDTRAFVTGSFFDTPSGREHYETVKAAGDVLEWSYVFTVDEAEEVERDDGATRVLKKIDVWSVDPVLRGAGIGTGTDTIKSLTREQPFQSHAAEIADALEAFAARAKERATVRAKEGRQLSASNVERLAGIAESLRSSADALEKLLRDASPAKAAIDLERERLLFMRGQLEAAGLLT